jgi:(p)ppGpp synthase/HD superfamily hydrolase
MRNEEYFEHLSSYLSMQEYVEELCYEDNIKIPKQDIKLVIQNIFDVKFADRIHNLSTQWDENNLEKVERKLEETKKYFLDISSRINIPAYRKIKTLILELEIKLANFSKKTNKILDK